MSAAAFFKRLIVFWLLCGVAIFALPSMAQEEEPDRVGAAFLDAANRLAQEGDWQRALLNYSLFIVLNPDYAEGYALRSAVYIALNDDEKALIDLSRAIHLADQDPEYSAVLYTLRAEVYILQEALEAALEDYARAIDLNPNYVIPYRNRGLVYDFLGEYTLALEDYSRALELEPTADFFVNRARLYNLLGQAESAVQDLDAALAINPENLELYVVRGSIHLALGDLPGAAADYAAWMVNGQTRRIELEGFESPETRRLTMERGWVYAIPFEAEAGDQLNVVANSSSVDALVVILAPDGTPLAADDDSGIGLNAFLLGVTAFESGTYTILLGHARGGWSGVVSLTIERTAFRGA